MVCTYIHTHTYINVHIYVHVCIYIHTYNGIILSHKKEGNNTFAATWIDQEIIILSEISQRDKDI